MAHLLLTLLTPRERRSAALLMGLMVLNAVVEAVGVAAVLPLLTVLNDPAIVEQHRGLQWMLAHLAGGSMTRLPIILCTVTLFVLIFNSAVRIGTEYAISRFVEMRRQSLSIRLLAGYLRQPWAWFLRRNSTDLTRSILSDVDTVVQAALLPALRIPVYALVVISLIAVLLIVDAVATIVAGTLVVGTYLAGDYLSRRWTLRQGTLRTTANRDRFSIVGEAVSGAKALKHLGRESEMVRRFRVPSRVFSRAMAVTRTAGVVPRFAVECVAIGGLLLWLIVRLNAGIPIADTLPLIGLYAFAGYRLMPACQQVFTSLTAIRFGLTLSHTIGIQLQELEAETSLDTPTDVASIEFRESVTLRHASYRYPGATHNAITNISFDVRAGETVALTGPTGAGKSTVIDVLLGLLSPDTGTMQVDGRVLTVAECRTWGRTVGYVPQHPFLADDSVLANVAFGVAPEARDRTAAARAVALAGLTSVVDGLPDGLDTTIGERGQRLSGGEQQRLAVARALYSGPRLLVLDEATAALDQATACDLLRRLRALSPRPAIVMVSHDAALLAYVDRTIHLEDGCLR